MSRSCSSSLRGLFSLLAVFGMLLGLVACNTTEGLGRDVSATGRAVSGAAEKAKP